MQLMWRQRDNAHMPQWLEDVVAAGYEGVALFDNDLLRYVEQTDFSERLGDMGLGVASVDVRITRDVDALRRTCEVMQRVGAQHMVALGGEARRGADVDFVADLLNQMGEIALTYGIRAGYHNHTGDVGETLEETELLLSKTDPRTFFGFLDVGHATKDFVGHPVAQRAAIFLERNWDRIDFLEFKDWSEQHDLCTEVGAGECDYGAVFRIVRERGYSGWITVEQNGPMGDKTPLECAGASRDFIREGLGV
jgi:sugar phosphate isomerase/epimerase